MTMTLGAPSLTPAFGVSAQFTNAGISTPLITPNTFEVTEEEYCHDILNMTFWGGDVNADALQTGEPVYAQWGTPPSVREFYGYVNHAGRINNALSTVSEPADRNATTVTAVGASWPMKEAGTQNWPNFTSSQIVDTIATQFNLSSNTTFSSTIWPSKQMGGLTYWQFCVKLAKEIGYTFYCNGIQLTFNPRQTNPNALGALAVIYDYKVDPASMPIFSPIVGTASPMGGQLYNRVMGGVDPRTVQLIYSQASGSGQSTNLGTYTGTPPFSKTEHFTVRSQQEADTKTSGAGLQNQLYITATATAAGNPLVSKGSLIYVQNANGSQNGLWFVTKVQHCVTKSNYQMQLWLGRDSMGATTSLGVIPAISLEPVAKLYNNTWVAA